MIQLVSNNVRSTAVQNWNDISKEKTGQQTKLVTDLFNEYQFDLEKLSQNLTSNQVISRFVQKSDSKKIFEEILKLNLNADFQVEIYNTRLELLSFKGRKLDSDVYSLQRCVNGKKFSVLKEIGFYTYLIIYSPIFDVRDQSQISGVMLTAKLIDIKYQINNKFFSNIGFLNEVNAKLQLVPQIIPANNISGKIDFDTTFLRENTLINLTGIDHNIIGILLLPKYNEISHLQAIDFLTLKIISLLVFVFTVILFVILYKLVLRFESQLTRFILFTVVLTGIRFLWIEYSFPSKIIGSEIFSPGFYASTIGFGAAKSLGEFLITSVFIMIIALYGLYLVSRINSVIIKTQASLNLPVRLTRNVLIIFVYFATIYLYGAVIHRVIIDSNLKFFDKSSIVPEVELFIIQLLILILTLSLFIFLGSLIIYLFRIHSINSGKKNSAKIFLLIWLILFLGINQLMMPLFDDIKIDSLYRLLTIVISFLSGAFLARKILLGKNIFSVKNLSIAFLFCIITIPGILLEKITSQETYFVELIGKKIAEKEDDRIKFLLMTELSNISENKDIEINLRNRDKHSELAFAIWTDSKFSEENFNTAVIVLDTNQKVLSNFIFNSQSINPDSITNYAGRNFFKKRSSFKPLYDTLISEDSLSESEIDEDEATLSDAYTDDLSSLYITDKILILKNEIEKYYLGIVQIERLGLKNTPFETSLGYLLIAVQYESKNFLVQASLPLFKNYSKDNLYDKLISNPVITEYSGDEIISSSDPELSKANPFSLEAFRESIKLKNEKLDWRYETINNEKYRTLYILESIDELTGSERIYSISLKRNDLKLTIFFYLKFILFVVFVYLVLLALISVILLTRINTFKLNFREKLFASFFIVSVIPIVLLAIYTRSFIKNKYDINFQNEIISDLNLVSQSLKGAKVKVNTPDSLSSNQSKLLTKSLNQTDKNFNLFLKTKLISTTDEELYKSDLLDTRIDAEAYYNIVYLRKDFFLKTEGIGVYSFIVGYKPFFDANNNVIGVMSSQTVYKQNEVNEELTEILTFIFGIYFIVIIILLVFVTFLTDRISKPILKLQNATERISKGESNVELNIKSKDEIGSLVESFNKMTKELETSKEKLKRAEREAAWRDIARRVAHEIKNPLTPMKLSIQHLYEAYDNGNKKYFSEVLKKTRTIIINEIDKLNRIATEFSNFAKLSGTNYEETDLNEVIEEVVSLYKLAPEIEFKASLDKNLDKIFADKQELNRVFQNLIKNSIQAIEGKGKIEVKTYQNGEYIYAEIVDNGSGIDASIVKNLFEPNFSTKSTGMGLGLAIAKKTLDDMKAEISFESNSVSGTRAIIKFIPYILKSNGLSV